VWARVKGVNRCKEGRIRSEKERGLISSSGRDNPVKKCTGMAIPVGKGKRKKGGGWEGRKERVVLSMKAQMYCRLFNWCRLLGERKEGEKGREIERRR